MMQPVLQRLAVLALSVVAIGVLGATRGDTQAMSSMAAQPFITGVIVDPNGDPAEGVPVAVFSDGVGNVEGPGNEEMGFIPPMTDPLAVARSDKDGKFEMKRFKTPLKEGRAYILRAGAKSIMVGPTALGSVKIKAGENKVELQLRSVQR